MATIVELCPTWINKASDPSVYRFFHNTSGLTRTKSVNGRYQETAAGRRRLIRVAGKFSEWQVEMFRLTDEDEEWLDDFMGETVCVRDDRGKKMFGTFLSMSMDEQTFPSRSADLTLQVTEITFSEAV